jgi:hypothetical protein
MRRQVEEAGKWTARKSIDDGRRQTSCSPSAATATVAELDTPYLRIRCHNAMDNEVMVTNANETITRLNLRIRLSYNCAQLSCRTLTDLRVAVSTNPLVFTYHFF